MKNPKAFFLASSALAMWLSAQPAQAAVDGLRRMSRKGKEEILGKAKAHHCSFESLFETSLCLFQGKLFWDPAVIVFPGLAVENGDFDWAAYFRRRRSYPQRKEK